jgi:hypothetical protein
VAAHPAFVALGAELDFLGIPELDVTALAARIDNEIIRLADAWEDARDSETIVADLERRVGMAREKAAATDAVVRSCAEEFARALPRIGLPCSATLVEAEPYSRRGNRSRRSPPIVRPCSGGSPE